MTSKLNAKIVGWSERLPWSSENFRRTGDLSGGLLENDGNRFNLTYPFMAWIRLKVYVFGYITMKVWLEGFDITPRSGGIRV